MTNATHAVYLVTNERLVEIAGLQAKRIAAQWQCDVHVFVERNEPFRTIREFQHENYVHYHYDQLGALLPSGLPEDDKWPRVVYMRLFAPQLLRNYSRLLYLDADIWCTRSEPRIWQVNLPEGIGAVSDIATLERAPYDIKDMTRNEWLRSIGVSSDRYLNSGMLLIDVGNWLQIDFAAELQRYFKNYPDARRYDQDFLSHLFNGKWTELGPRLNYQAYVLELGLTRSVSPVFIHFCRNQKPWHGDCRGWRAPTDPRYTEMYQKLMHAEGIYPRAFLRANPVNGWRRLRYGARAWLGRHFGIVSRRELRERKKWQSRSDAFFRFMSDGLASGRFADETRGQLDAPRSEAIFDGRFVIGAENRPPELAR